MTRFSLDGKTYEFAQPEHISGRDFIRLDNEVRDDPDLGPWLAAKGVTDMMSEVSRLASLFFSLEGAERSAHSESAWMLQVTIWLAMVKKARDNGEAAHVPFTAALDANLATFAIVPDPVDHAGKAKAPRTGRPKASAVAGAPQAAPAQAAT